MPRSTMYFEAAVHQDVTSITMDKRADCLFCICCLNTNEPLISLITCRHSEYLDYFSKPELKPGSQLVCFSCHEILTKIQIFKQKVQKSFKMLFDKALNLDKLNQRHNLELHKAVNIGIPGYCVAQSIKRKSTIDKPQITRRETETLKRSNKKIDNIQTALDIIKSNNNMTFLAASALNADSLFKFTNTLLNMDMFQEISNNDVPSKKVKLKSQEEIQSRSNQVEPNINQTQLDSNVLQTEPNGIQSETNAMKTESIEIQSNPNGFNSETNVINTETIDIKTYPIDQSDPCIIQSETNLIDTEKTDAKTDPTDPNIIQSETTILKSKPIEIQPNPNEMQSKTNITGIPNKTPYILQPDSNKTQSPSNQMVNRKPTVPKSHKDKIRVVRISETQLQEERARLSEDNEYLRREHKCVACIVSFQYKDNYDDHMKRKHSVDSGGIVCEICSQRLATETDYECHLSRHYKRYQCMKCDKRFQICDEAIRHYHSVHVQKKFKIRRLKGKYYKCQCEH